MQYFHRGFCKWNWQAHLHRTGRIVSKCFTKVDGIKMAKIIINLCGKKKLHWIQIKKSQNHWDESSNIKKKCIFQLEFFERKSIRWAQGTCSTHVSHKSLHIFYVWFSSFFLLFMYDLLLFYMICMSLTVSVTESLIYPKKNLTGVYIWKNGTF